MTEEREKSERGDALRRQAKAVLATNDRGTYTVPTDSLYPFQWNWDSAFTAMGLATFNTDRAWTELETLFSAQWPSGFVPHIVFHEIVESYFPGHSVWGTRHTPASSGISQPPLAATATRFILEHSTDRAASEARAAQLYRRILAWHDWWARERDPESQGLVGVIHPWEAGADNTPVWDEPLAAVPPTQNPYRRRDTGLLDESVRPTKFEYDRYLYLVELYRSLNWNDREIWKHAPFKIAEMGLNSILAGDERNLLALASRFGSQADRFTLAERAERRKSACERLWDEASGMYLSLDLLTNRTIQARTHAGFLPLWGGLPTQEHAERMAQELLRWMDLCTFGAPTVSPDDPAFERRRYWRGPVWAIVNWLLGEGLARYGFTDLSERLRRSTLQLINRSGFQEYYDPLSGDGLGGRCFTWTAATYLAWVQPGERITRA